MQARYKANGYRPAYETLGGELPQRKKRERRPDGLMGRRQRPIDQIKQRCEWRAM
jgi:hypothetical protein